MRAVMGKPSSSTRPPLGNTLGNEAGVDDGTVLANLLARGSSCLPAKVMDALVLLAPPSSRVNEPPASSDQASNDRSPNGRASSVQPSSEQQRLSVQPSSEQGASSVQPSSGWAPCEVGGLEGGREISDAHWAVTSAVLSGRSVRELPTDWIAEELVLIEAVERVNQWILKNFNP